jgi:hypothetical protein
MSVATIITLVYVANNIRNGGMILIIKKNENVGGTPGEKRKIIEAVK